METNPYELSSETQVDERGRLTVGCVCGKKLQVPKFRAGKVVNCPACKQDMSVPALPVQNPTTMIEAEQDESIALAENVRTQLDKINMSAKKSIGKNLATLAFSIVLFISLGLLRGSLSGVAILVGVIFIHECGHLVAMKILKYKDVQMFFIPLFGAAVAGRETVPSGAKKAIVSLLGPAPGILLGIATGFAYILTGHALLADATRTFLLINTFNLLPFHPLDGGQIFDALIFSRHPRIEVGFKVITALILAGLAFVFKDIFLGIFSFFILLSIRGTHITASVAHGVRKEIDENAESSLDEIPREQLQCMIELLKEKLPKEHWKPSVIATFASGSWQRICNKPCSIGKTIGLISCYVFVFVLGVFSVLFFEAVVYHVSQLNNQAIEQRHGPYREYSDDITHTSED
ncbi:hypothetical protein BVX97_03620 [bacterium E08(2017)]|nr:hypothetical protein BVX97_03620 [bacterium E08(2017)]